MAYHSPPRSQGWLSVEAVSVPAEDLDAGSEPAGRLTGADGHARVPPASVAGPAIREFRIPTPSSHPQGVAKEPDGNGWFSETSANKIGRLTPGGVYTEFPISTVPGQ